MKLVFLTPGTGSYYCGVCMRDNALARDIVKLDDTVFIGKIRPRRAIFAVAHFLPHHQHGTREPTRRSSLNVGPWANSTSLRKLARVDKRG